MSGRDSGPVQVRGQILSTRRAGAYHHITLLAPGVAESAKPGHFVALTVGGDQTSMLLRRSFSIHKVSPTGVYGGTVDVVVADAGRGTHWLTTQPVGTPIDLVGPMGRAFPLPKEPVSCTLVGGGYGTAPLFWLAEVLREKGCRVDIVLGAATEQRLFGVVEARRVATTATVTTDDGSAGTRGMVTAVLGDVLERTDASVVYACGPMGMLRAVTDVATAHGVVAQVAVEEAMACGVGICMTCVMPVVGSDGATRMVRSCVEGPVFRGDRVRWRPGTTASAKCPTTASVPPR
jgi:dihydroorotate dehydrogenase electron transfer subunit